MSSFNSPRKVEAGTAKLVGTSTDTIINEVRNLLNYNKNYYHNMVQATNPYGDGQSCKYIFDILEKMLFC
ncbi:MAG: UDP-N-acetylglucosamine 2-epimerase [Rickettsia sp.]|nr:UDP-N-acetylglucosamine 2-epimerase [Rickettsia sp.]